MKDYLFTERYSVFDYWLLCLITLASSEFSLWCLLLLIPAAIASIKIHSRMAKTKSQGK